MISCQRLMRMTFGALGGRPPIEYFGFLIVLDWREVASLIQVMPCVYWSYTVGFRTVALRKEYEPILN